MLLYYKHEDYKFGRIFSMKKSGMALSSVQSKLGAVHPPDQNNKISNFSGQNSCYLLKLNLSAAVSIRF